MKVVLNRRKTKTKEILAEEQAGFTADRIFTKISLSVKNAFNINKICTFKKAFDMGMTRTLIGNILKKNSSANLFRGIEHLYGKAIGEVHMNGITEEWLIISLNVTMPSLAYSLLYFFLERVISDGKASICGRTMTNHRFSDNIEAPDCRRRA